MIVKKKSKKKKVKKNILYPKFFLPPPNQKKRYFFSKAKKNRLPPKKKKFPTTPLPLLLPLLQPPPPRTDKAIHRGPLAGPKNRRQYPYMYPNDEDPSAILKLRIAFNESVETVSVEILQSGITVNVQFQIKHCVFLFHLMVC